LGQVSVASVQEPARLPQRFASNGIDQPGCSISVLLEAWERFAAREARALNGFYGRLHPRGEFFELILTEWICAGGLLVVSRAGSESKQRGRLGGPTVRYLQAVTAAVMGFNAPTLEGLRKIIERWRAQFECVYCSDLELMAYLEAIQVGKDELPNDNPTFWASTFSRLKRMHLSTDERRSRTRRLLRGPRMIRVEL
jgi:hypothetical protein